MTNEPMETTVLEPVKSCVDCAVKACRKGEADKYPAFCLTKNMDPALLEEAIDAYSEEENHKVMEAASAAEAKFRSKMTRVEETIEFAKRMGAKKIGIGTCMGLLDEAKIFTKILRKHGFEVYGVCCADEWNGCVPRLRNTVLSDGFDVGAGCQSDRRRSRGRSARLEYRQAWFRILQFGFHMGFRISVGTCGIWLFYVQS